MRLCDRRKEEGATKGESASPHHLPTLVCVCMCV